MDFKLEGVVGSLSVETATEVATLREGEASSSLSGLSFARKTEVRREDGVVKVYAATFEGPREVALGRRCFAMLKEYSPGARSIAEAEVEAYGAMLADDCELPTFDAASPPTLREPPVEPLLGYFEAVGVDAGEVPAESSLATNSLWLVYRVGLGGLRWTDPPPTLAWCARDLGRALRAEERRPARSWPLGGGKVDDAAGQAAARLTELVRSSCVALDFVHSKGVVHRSLSAESLLVASVDQGGAPPQLRVCVANFGFAAVLPDPRTDAEFEEVRTVLGEDVHALGVALVTAVVQALMLPAPRTAGSAPVGEGEDDPDEDEEFNGVPGTIKRLLGGLLSSDIGALRSHAEAQPRWERACAWLEQDDDAGWELVEALACERAPMREVMQKRLVRAPEPNEAMKAAATVSDTMQQGVDDATGRMRRSFINLFDGLGSKYDRDA